MSGTGPLPFLRVVASSVAMGTLGGSALGAGHAHQRHAGMRGYGSASLRSRISRAPGSRGLSHPTLRTKESHPKDAFRSQPPQALDKAGETQVAHM